MKHVSDGSREGEPVQIVIEAVVAQGNKSAVNMTLAVSISRGELKYLMFSFPRSGKVTGNSGKSAPLSFVNQHAMLQEFGQKRGTKASK